MERLRSSADGEILAHLFNHQTHHRGQAHAVLTMLGMAEPDPLDLLIMQRERAYMLVAVQQRIAADRRENAAPAERRR